MNLFPEHITINNHRKSIKSYLGTNHPTEYENELAGFLAEWYNKNDFIEVQTSGSTGTPKTIRLKKLFVWQSAIRTIDFFNLQPGDRILHCLPVRYIAGKLMVVRALAGNLNLYAVASDTDFSFLQNESFRFAAMVPHQVQKILSGESSPGLLLHQIEKLLIGGSSIPYPLESKLQKLKTEAYSSYAMTETATHIALRRINAREADTSYHCLNDITVQTNDEGCLLIHMPGLPVQPLKTNDIATIVDEKTFKIEGRADNVIISGGIKYSPEKLEKKLEPLIDIPFFISSVPHASLGEQLILIAEGSDDKRIRNHIQLACRKALSKYEQPRQILIVQQLPRTGNGKIIRKGIHFPEL